MSDKKHDPLAGDMPELDTFIRGLKCPTCKTNNLFLASGNYITCANLGCPQPDYAEAVQSKRLIVAGEPATMRLMRQVKQQCKYPKLQPTPYQVAVVLHALADHTAIMAMLQHRPDPTSPWPEATSIGRWFHDVGDSLEDGNV